MTIPTTTEVIPAALWLPLQEQIIRGLNHTLSNRAASLSAVGALIDDPEPGLMLGEMMAEDTARLIELLELYRELVAADAATPQACMVEPLLVRALAYASHHGGLRSHAVRSVVASPAPTPVVLFPATLLRLLLLSLAGVVGTLAKAQASVGILVDLRDEAGDVRIEVRVEAPTSEGAATATAFEPFAAALSRLRGRAREERTVSSYSWVYFLPALRAGA